MKYADFLVQKSFTHQQLLALSQGRLVEDAPARLARLPAPPLLMFHRVVELERGSRGRIVAEQDIHLDAWYFQYHFAGDPVQAGCLGVDAVWQLVGLYILANGGVGSALRVLGSKEIEFFGQIRPHDQVVRYEVEITDFTQGGEHSIAEATGDAKILVDGEHIYTIQEARVGLFSAIEYTDYPHCSENAVGGGRGEP